MPTYEYACRDCGEHLEVVQSFADDPLTVCPECDGELRKVYSAAGIVFKGSGWHIKDYGTSKSASRPRGDEAASGSGTSSDADSSSEARSSDAGSSDADSSSDASADSDRKSA